ncbi:unnamed protein product [Closterium sp. NIES-65]|nr:unnamed protein product [Closterium sp. NIES-65]
MQCAHYSGSSTASSACDRDAYYTLLRPLLSRAKYLLRASGVTAAELSGDRPGSLPFRPPSFLQFASSHPPFHPSPSPRPSHQLRASGVTAAELSGDSPGRDQQLLMEVMELRETVEDADSPEELQALQSQTQERMEGLYSSFDDVFRRGDVGACVGLLHRMAYFQRVANEIDNRLHSM